MTHKTRSDRLKRGFCGECGKRLMKRGHTRCEPCLDRQRRKMRSLRISRKAVRVRLNPTIVSSPSDIWLPPDDKGDISE